jgi:hypothetical protein
LEKEIIAVIFGLWEQADRSRQRGGIDGQGPGKGFSVAVQAA